MLENLALSAVMIVATSAVHFVGLAALLRLLQSRAAQLDRAQQYTVLQFALTGVVVLSLFGLHAIQIFMYALVYLLLGEFQTLEAALYFSTSTFTTVGFGDIFLSEEWRLFSAIESANGFLLIGWSTAFLVSVTARIRVLEAMGPQPPAEEPD